MFRFLRNQLSHALYEIQPYRVYKRAKHKIPIINPWKAIPSIVINHETERRLPPSSINPKPFNPSCSMRQTSRSGCYKSCVIYSGQWVFVAEEVHAQKKSSRRWWVFFCASILCESRVLFLADCWCCACVWAGRRCDHWLCVQDVTDKLTAEVVRYMLFKAHKQPDVPVKREELTRLVTDNHPNRSYPGVVISNAQVKKQLPWQK